MSENLFGIVADKWCNFQKPLNLCPEKACTITTCAVVLHDFLRKSLKETSLGVFSSSIVSQVGRKTPKNAKVIREIFTEYFINEGSVEWQWNKA